MFLKGTAGLIVRMGIKSSERARSYVSLGIGQPISWSIGTYFQVNSSCVYDPHMSSAGSHSSGTDWADEEVEQILNFLG